VEVVIAAREMCNLLIGFESVEVADATLTVVLVRYELKLCLKLVSEHN
jgi:hypothetical protein